ncbi:Predicted ATPase [Enterobacter hormaechei]|uniref:AAA domain-containing protein n=1 Tax=Enterobacter hormaechei TaxID=158836 RepID=UPI0005F0AA8F|nr:AAA domain-containing protein [Enterobacter hormaechei]HCJ7329685.1 AAA family ATPase [Enterobacter hormaechei subsp. xiangfangensis]ASQ78094.1 nuclease [Enterobacter hormaechei]ELD3410345.1 AAA family ATPase [Enterobacter hormaechei]KJO65796.1 nuclease [Enterobacter hormaechei subsp. steigerwaltii]MCO6030506.1 AAA domain-containing protein [Enterobacter hormaechei]
MWDGGLQEQEVAAIEKIKAAFSDNLSMSDKPVRGGSIGEQLQRYGYTGNGMFPWKGYAGFRFVEAKKEGEFDLVIVTHCNVIIVELKDWNHQPVTARGETWYKGDKNMGRSPVSVTRGKKFTLDNKLKRLADRFTNKGYVPFVHFFVVMTGNADFSELPEEQLHHTISLTDFLKFADRNTFNNYFRPHPSSQVLNKDFPLFDTLFLGPQTAAKALRVNGFEAKDMIFEHPKKVYREYLAKSEISVNSEALLRVWNFRNIQGTKAYTPEGRAEIVSREREVLQHINHQNRDLYNHCLRSLTSFQKDEVTAEYSEVYELPPGHVRFNEFIGKYGKAFSDLDRLNVVKLLIAKFSDLHEMKIAHRDIADHSLWISPSKEVALSNFISAYHRPAGTVGDYRKLLSVGAVEVKDMLDGGELTPFQQDVHALGLVAWHLLSGKRMSPKSLETVQDSMLNSQHWYSYVLLDAVAAKFASATEFFDVLKQAEPAGKAIPTFDDTELDPYRHAINHSRQYREDDDFLVETSDKEVYISGGRVVKAWLNVGGQGDDPSVNFQVMKFLKQVEQLSLVKPTYLPEIREFGIASKSSSLYLVTDQVLGETWDNMAVPDDEKIDLIDKFVAAVEHLHGLGVSHGDIHPGNVMLGTQSRSLFLIDIPDFSPSGDETKNHSYSPEYIDNCTSFERDNYAVMKMSCELLGLSWGQESGIYPTIANAIRAELEDPVFGFKDLGRFKKAIDSNDQAPEQPLIDITVGNTDEIISVLPDNGHLYVKVEPNPKAPAEVKVTFTGIGGSFTAVFNKEQKTLIHGFRPRARATIRKQDIDESQFEIGTGIRIIPGRPQDMSALTVLLNEEESFTRAIELIAAPEDVQEQDPLTLQLKDAFARLDKQALEPALKEVLEIPTVKLWRAILDTETESYPNIEVSGEVVPVADAHGELLLPYSADVDPLGAFRSSDEVEALQVDQEGVERFIGEVSLKKSELKEIRLVKVRSAAYRLKDSDIVFFRTRQDRASYQKRKRALERLLDRESVLPDLIDLFDPSCKQMAQNYGITLSDDDFARYDREDQHGNKISLNEQQRKAFNKLVNNGPLSLLQGPPGTGKTEFIAAFVHYLIEKQNTKRILLVSQSHEAVNTAAERIRKHCSRLGTELDVVRFSNREGAVSPGLKDVYSNAITTEKRELFNAEIKYRVEALSEAIGLEPGFISGVVLADLRLFRQIDHLEKLLYQVNDLTDSKEIGELKEIAVELDFSIRSRLSQEYGINLDKGAKVSAAKDILISKLCTEYGVRPDEARRVKALAKISRDMQDAMSGERVNLDEFYSRSRQLVAGTCVGIGQGHIGIQENIYDWVIIDEAARSIASELAIAMQSARRVLLVGDHLQLPPLYSDAHKAALARKLGINNSRTEIDEVLRSDFARAFNSAYGAQASAALLTQYRMAPPIGDLVSKTFYDRKLLNGERAIPDVYQHAPEALCSVVTWLDTANLGHRAHHLEDRGTSIYNRCEADEIISVLKQVSENEEFVAQLSKLVNKDEAAIGVICMYAEQKRLLRQKFNQEIWSEGFKDIVKIDTVDSYQGKENRIIILSLTRSDKQHSPGFLRAPNRINVAMSRAMDRLLIVGNADIWKGNNKELPLGSVVSYMAERGQEAGYRFLSAQQGGKKK